MIASSLAAPFELTITYHEVVYNTVKVVDFKDAKHPGSSLLLN
jgi:hypothetical protein